MWAGLAEASTGTPGGQEEGEQGRGKCGTVRRVERGRAHGQGVGGWIQPWGQTLTFLPAPGSPNLATQSCNTTSRSTGLSSPIWAAACYLGKGENISPFPWWCGSTSEHQARYGASVSACLFLPGVWIVLLNVMQLPRPLCQFSPFHPNPSFLVIMW